MSLKKLFTIEDEAHLLPSSSNGAWLSITTSPLLPTRTRDSAASSFRGVSCCHIIWAFLHILTTREGFALLSKKNQGRSKTKIIVITGNSENENAVRAIGMGATDFCAKPIDLSLLNIILARTFRIYES